MLARYIELHDSELDSVSIELGTATLKLSPAYLHKWERNGDRVEGTGWTQNASIRVWSASVEGAAELLPKTISNSEVCGANYRGDGLLKVGSMLDGEIFLKLVLISSEILVVRGSALLVELHGIPQFVEALPPEFEPADGAA